MNCSKTFKIQMTCLQWKKKVLQSLNASIGELRQGSRRGSVEKARLIMFWYGVREGCYSGTDVARYFSATNSCVTRMVSTGRKPDMDAIDLAL